MVVILVDTLDEVLDRVLLRPKLVQPSLRASAVPAVSASGAP